MGKSRVPGLLNIRVHLRYALASFRLVYDTVPEATIFGWELDCLAMLGRIYPTVRKLVGGYQGFPPLKSKIDETEENSQAAREQERCHSKLYNPRC